MPKVFPPFRNLIRELEQVRGRRTVVYHSNQFLPKPLGLEDVRPVYECLRQLGSTESVDLLLNTEGGQVAAGYRLTRLLLDVCGTYNILIARRAGSAGTLMCLAADSIVMSQVGEMTPIDASVAATRNTTHGSPNMVSATDIRAVGKIAKRWFGCRDAESSAAIFRSVADAFFPAALGNLFNCDRYTRLVAAELINARGRLRSRRAVDQLVRRLVDEYGIHSHPIPCSTARAWGMPARDATRIEESLLLGIHDAIQAWIHVIDEKDRGKTTLSAVACTTDIAFGFEVRMCSTSTVQEGGLLSTPRWKSLR